MYTQPLPTLFNRLLYGESAGAPQPPLDLFELPDRYELLADLPGVAKDAVELEFDAGVLSLRGERQTAAPADQTRSARRERGGGKFLRRVAFGDEIDAEGIEASVKDGVLRVRVPKAERAKARQIPVAVQ